MNNDFDSDAMEVFFDVLSGKSPDKAIRDQESRGQRNFVNSETLPKEINYGELEQFEKMGIVFHEDADDLFVYVTLPEGWSKIPTSHSMWSKLTDEFGRERASIFYKAAFYDRSAFMNISRRFNLSVYKEFEDGLRRWVALDGEEVIFVSDPFNFDDDIPSYEESKILSGEAELWMNSNYPNWRDPMAYWEE